MIQRKTPMRRSYEAKLKHAWNPALKAPPAAKKPKAKLGAGKKTKAWDSLRAKLKVRFKAAGITDCELRYAGCWRDNTLGFAHSLKRRNIISADLLEEVCLACSSCHDKIEIKPEAEMRLIVVKTIAARRVPVARIFVPREVVDIEELKRFFLLD